MTSKHARALIFGIIVSLLALFFAFRGVDIGPLIDSILAANPAWMLLVLLSYMLHFWLKAVRWCDLLEPVYRARIGEAYPVMMTGFFANNLLPAHLGEFVRMYVGARFFKVSKTQVLATIMLERIFDFSVIALMFGVALISGGSISNRLIYAGYTMIVVTVVVFLLLFLSLRYETLTYKFVEWLLRPFPVRMGSRIVGTLKLVLLAMHSMKSMRLVMRSIVLSLLQWFLVGLAIYSALSSVGVEIDVAGTVVTLAATVLAVGLPTAPGFFGTIQLAFVLALVPYGVTESDALAGSVIFHMVSYLFVMVSGVIALHQLNMRVSDLRHEVDEI